MNWHKMALLAVHTDALLQGVGCKLQISADGVSGSVICLQAVWAAGQAVSVNDSSISRSYFSPAGFNLDMD